MPFSRGSSQPGIKLRSPALQADSLPSEPPGKLVVGKIFFLVIKVGNLTLYIVSLIILSHTK